jgi:hypothetical protein
MIISMGRGDYSHHDYAKENRELQLLGQRQGAADRAAGKEPNGYLYHYASPNYAHAKGYRVGYDMLFPAEVLHHASH